MQETFAGKRRHTKTGFKVVLAMALLGMAGTVSAAETWVADYLTQVYPLQDGSFILTFQNSPPACTSPANPKYLTVAAGHYGVTAEGVKAMLATSLMALAAGKQIQAAFDNSTSECYINRLRVVN